jgi:hypothetical protein
MRARGARMVGPMSMGKQPSGEDVEVLARTVWAEARGESLAGQIAVAFTAVHRARIARGWREQRGTPHPHFGDGTVASACLAPEQYSCWNGVTDFRRADLADRLEQPEFQTALYVALAVLQRLVSDVLPDSTHYFSPSRQAAEGAREPVWVTGRTGGRADQPAIKPARFIASVGNHLFYGDVA